jgi:hypothetical protein
MSNHEDDKRKSKDDKKKCKNNNLILLELIKENKITELDEKEIELKNKLTYIENKLESVKKTMKSIAEDNNDSFYSDSFDILVGSIAMTAAISTIAEYFDIKIEDVDNFMK